MIPAKKESLPLIKRWYWQGNDYLRVMVWLKQNGADAKVSWNETGEISNNAKPDQTLVIREFK